MQQTWLYRPPTWHPRPQRIRPFTRVAGFDFDTAAGFIFADLAGVFTGLARESAVDITMRVYSVATGALVHETATLTTDGNGRLARYETSAVAVNTAYHLLFVRESDGEVCAAKMTAT
jgi:hypothetical protein